MTGKGLLSSTRLVRQSTLPIFRQRPAELSNIVRFRRLDCLKHLHLSSTWICEVNTQLSKSSI